jgi:hypothetical protein
MPVKKRKGKRKPKPSSGADDGSKPKRKYPNITDLSLLARYNDSRSRIGKKIFNKSTLKRLASKLDAADKKRVGERFGEQWNYL